MKTIIRKKHSLVKSEQWKQLIEKLCQKKPFIMHGKLFIAYWQANEIVF